MDHARWKTARTREVLRDEVRESPAVTAIRLEVQYARALGEAVCERRTALGLTPSEVARRANMSQPQFSRIEGGDTVPTLPLLERLARALDSELDIHLAPGTGATLNFTG
ncbi:helix-turn-helix transcriptional regulator [Streptomyces sp. RB6PN25]|uniref:Helix-turn-helix transcriptional regulator n=1 Tax=Streptomyces humicola TaxID=2953240 RepID=A0ABT1PUZ3_9ACTN|nr:helix-turn-helix transcriptional regulator [Streptomyces humicola]MCQ4080360.1 helix-turn-helix transcriptional regulator [Streptomyces humicola]